MKWNGLALSDPWIKDFRGHFNHNFTSVLNGLNNESVLATRNAFSQSSVSLAWKQIFGSVHKLLCNIPDIFDVQN